MQEVAFIRTATGEIKVTQTHDLRTRMEMLQHAHPRPLELLGTLPASECPKRWARLLLGPHAIDERRDWYEPGALPVVCELLGKKVQPTQEELFGPVEPIVICKVIEEPRPLSARARSEQLARERREKRAAWRRKHMQLRAPDPPPELHVSPEEAARIVRRALGRLENRSSTQVVAGNDHTDLQPDR